MSETTDQIIPTPISEIYDQLLAVTWQGEDRQLGILAMDHWFVTTAHGVWLFLTKDGRLYLRLDDSDLDPGKPCRAMLIDWATDTCGFEAVHLEDAAMVPDATWHRVGNDCAARVGAEWFADWSEVSGV